MCKKRCISYLLILAMLVMMAVVNSPTNSLASGIDNTRGGIGFQCYYGDADLARAATDCDNLNVGWARIDCSWAEVQSGGSGSWNWTQPDRQTAAALGKGLKVLLLLTYAPGWANGNQNQYTYHSASYVNNWKAFCDAAVRRYLPQGITAYELWNEPNLAPNRNVANYVNNILKPGADSVRAASVALQRAVTVVQGGMAYCDDPNMTAYGWLQGIYSNGGKNYFDVANTHPYCFPNPAPNVYSSYNHLYRASELHDIMVNNSDGSKQIWATEYGFPTKGTGSVSEATASSWMQLAYDVWCQTAWRSWTGPMFVYVYRNNQYENDTDPYVQQQATFGLLRYDWTYKPAFSTVQSVLANTSTYPPPPAPATSGYGPTATPTPTTAATPTPVPGGTQLINGCENLSQWAGEAARTANTAQKTEGAQSIKNSYTVPASGWANSYYTIASPYLNLSTATNIKIDIYPLTQTPSGRSEPISFKVQDQTAGVIYESQIGNLTANQWNTVTISLSGIPAANRQKIKEINLYLWSGWTNEINGRTKVEYYYDNLRATVPGGSTPTPTPIPATPTPTSAATSTPTPAATPTPTPGGTNLLQNPGFESGTASWALASHASVSSADKRTGTYSLRLAGTGDWCNTFQTVNLAANTNYTLRVYGKCGAAQIVKVVNASNWTVINSVSTTANNSWTQYSFTFNSGSNTQVNVVVTDSASGTSYYDDFSLTVG